MNAMLPLLLLLGAALGMIRRVKVYDAFAFGAQRGLKNVWNIAPSICAAVICVGLIKRCGLMDDMAAALSPAMQALGIPEQAVSLMLLRPLSGGACIAILQDVIDACGPDSFQARAACAMMGSTETVFYTMAVYVGAAGAKRSAWVLAISLMTCFAGGICACWICAIM